MSRRDPRKRLKIALTDQRKPIAHYLIAIDVAQPGREWEQRARAPEEFEAASSPAKNRLYDDAFTIYGEWI